MKKQFAVIGLGRFGTSLCRTLTAHGHEVLAIDNDFARVQEAINTRIATHAIQLDSTDEEALKAVGIKNFDVVVVAIGTHKEESILTAVILKDLGISQVVAKAMDSRHGKVLEKIGADKVVYPERDMGERIAHNLMSNTLDFFEIAPNFSIIDVKAPAFMVGKTLRDLQLRIKHRVTLLAIKREEKNIFIPTADDLIAKEDVLVMMGNDDDLGKISGK